MDEIIKIIKANLAKYILFLILMLNIFFAVSEFDLITTLSIAVPYLITNLMLFVSDNIRQRDSDNLIRLDLENIKLKMLLFEAKSAIDLLNNERNKHE